MIKFRAWDKRSETYLYNVQDAYDTLSGFVKYDDGEDAEYDEECFGGFLNDERYVVEQFTGLTDVNGKGVYEGDIIQPIMLYTDRNIGKPFEVKKGNYVYGKWIAKDVSSKGFGVNDYYFSNEIKVSGNAYTNPKLLKGENN